VDDYLPSVLFGLGGVISVSGERIVETDLIEVCLHQGKGINFGRGSALIENICANIEVIDPFVVN
jgi:hypothetical protein